MTHTEDITIYSKSQCPYCSMAKKLLEQHNLTYQEINVANDPEQLATMLQRSQRRTVPQIFFGDKHIGGYTDLVAYFQQK